MTAAIVYITTPNKDEALRIGRVLVEERLAACVNIVDGMTSLYWWKGNIEAADETVLLAKTRHSLVEPLIEKVKSLHSYDCPCIIANPIDSANPDYLKWIENETAGKR